jgi:hypothetical protein
VFAHRPRRWAGAAQLAAPDLTPRCCE